MGETILLDGVHQYYVLLSTIGFILLLGISIYIVWKYINNLTNNTDQQDILEINLNDLNKQSYNKLIEDGTMTRDELAIGISTVWEMLEGILAEENKLLLAEDFIELIQTHKLYNFSEIKQVYPTIKNYVRTTRTS